MNERKDGEDICRKTGIKKKMGTRRIVTKRGKTRGQEGDFYTNRGTGNQTKYVEDHKWIHKSVMHAKEES